jgi:hypothetical protein
MIVGEGMEMAKLYFAKSKLLKFRRIWIFICM